MGLANKLRGVLKGWQLKGSYNVRPSLTPEEFEKFIRQNNLEDKYKGFVDYRTRKNK